jgi:hypothetical protein
MKRRTFAGALIASAASFALVVGVALPANAYPQSGSINCPSNMVARLSLTTSQAGSIKWEKPMYNGYQPSDTWIATSYNRYLVFYARANGPARWVTDSKFTVTASCSR